MKKVWGKKFISLLLALFAVAMLIVAVMAIGFKYQNISGSINLKDLYQDTFDGVDWAIATRTLIVSGIVLSGCATIGFLISTIIGRALLVVDRILWFIAVVVLTLGMILVVAGEAYFATHWRGFKDLFDQGAFAGMLIATIVPSLIAISMAGYTLNQPNKK